MRLSISLALSLAPSVVAAQDFSASNALPFSYSIVAMGDVFRGGEAFTVTTLRITNGDRHVRVIEFSCEAGNAAGYTWDVRGEVRNLGARETRDARIVSTGGEPEYFAEATRLHCAVAGYDAAL